MAILERMTKLRGALSQIQGRFEPEARSPVDDGWPVDNAPAAEFRTTVTEERARSIVSHNDSPDIPFEQSINPYRGCEHGCIYCYARPSHAYLELSPGLDFETKLFAKTNAAELLQEELSRRGFIPALEKARTNAAYPPFVRRLLTLDASTLLTPARFFVLDDHMNASGHQVIGEALAGPLRARVDHAR